MQPTTEEQLLHKELWEGEIPLMIRLAEDEVIPRATGGPDAVFVMGSRMSYLPIVCADAVEYLKAFAPPHIDGVWFECDGMPCKWQIPLGVLYDQLSLKRRKANEAMDLPWALTLHFLSFPASTIMRCPDELTVKRHFLNNLKEGNYLKHGDNSKTNDLSLAEQDTLWQAIVQNDPVPFWSVNKKLAPADGFRNVAVRVCREGKPAVQEPIEQEHDDGRPVTLWDVLKQTTGIDATEESPAILVQGVRPRLDTPIAWLCLHCSHPDSFLYVSVGGV